MNFKLFLPYTIAFLIQGVILFFLFSTLKEDKSVAIIGMLSFMIAVVIITSMHLIFTLKQNKK
jgi:hypothetical protein